MYDIALLHMHFVMYKCDEFGCSGCVLCRCGQSPFLEFFFVSALSAGDPP